MSLKQPARYPVKYYSHLDAEAPLLADANGVIKTILKACLVTGYGTKESAGWTALFEDDFRIVLRRPLRTGNPPDIKIENGVIGGVSKHRIVSQDDPTGLDDATELAVVNLLARDSERGSNWHLIVSDFGFVLCYGMGAQYRAYKRGQILYIGSFKKMIDSDLDFFGVSAGAGIALSGVADSALRGFLDSTTLIRNMRTNQQSNAKSFLNLTVAETYYNSDYLAQQVICDNRYILPFYCSLSSSYDNTADIVASIDGRSMLRFVNVLISDTYTPRAFYIPLDYWEL